MWVKFDARKPGAYRQLLSDRLEKIIQEKSISAGRGAFQTLKRRKNNQNEVRQDPEGMAERLTILVPYIMLCKKIKNKQKNSMKWRQYGVEAASNGSSSAAVPQCRQQVDIV